MDLNLSLNETRVLGALIEKEITTPEQYPLSLNSLTTACNQKSNRDPVLALDESTVQQTVDDLSKKHLVSEASGFGSRVTKIQHRFCNTEFGKLKLTPQELGIICVLFLRGPQTPGELRTRTNRLCDFSDVSEVDQCLKELKERDDGPFVVKLEREPGKRESRYAHLLSGSVAVAMTTSHAAPPSSNQNESTAYHSPNDHSPEPGLPVGNESNRLDILEATVNELRNEVNELKEKLADLLD